jgi:hypothetical protein
VVSDHDEGLRVKRRSGISVVPARPGGKRKDHPELFFPRGFTPPSDCLESQPMHLLGIGVWDAIRLIDPQNPPTSPGGWVCAPPYGRASGSHPHRCSTDFEQTLLGGHLTRRGVECPLVMHIGTGRRCVYLYCTKTSGFLPMSRCVPLDFGVVGFVVT